ncbi:MAG TPA: glycosyltransferase [Candidatus Saccharimonadia bacterium]|nr:glycosyltransferase [Candidatus Saccharimonadia bacterium]
MKQTTNLPFMSIVICVFNGERGLGRAIESLLDQNYPKDRFEVVIVDDGSVDGSVEVASQYPVRIVQHTKNMGVAAARNTGLEAVRGDVYVCFDDDLEVSREWLRNLATGYDMPNILGVGSLIAPPKNIRGVVDRFMVAVGSGNPPSLKHGVSKSPLKRFIAYVHDQMDSGETDRTEPYPVRQLNGALSSFPVDVLRKIGGWNPDMRRMEDTDVCTRLERAFPNRFFYAVPSARIVHDPKMDTSAFLRRTYVRGVDNLKFYLRNGLTPPIFPFPLAWIFGSAILAVINPWLGLAGLLLLPQLLYVWWPIRGARELSLWYLLFPYLQAGEELATVLGLVRGFVVLTKGRRHAR